MIKGKSFSVDVDKVDRLVGQIISYPRALEAKLDKKMNEILEVVWRTAHARRPYISKTQMKREGRSKRVSDPNAQAGVPVDTGALQVSIKKELVHEKDKVVARIYVDNSVSNPKSGESVGDYAAAVEFGTSRMQARPFMRPAININKSWIRRKFQEPN